MPRPQRLCYHVWCTPPQYFGHSLGGQGWEGEGVSVKTEASLPPCGNCVYHDNDDTTIMVRHNHPMCLRSIPPPPPLCTSCIFVVAVELTLATFCNFCMLLHFSFFFFFFY